MERATCTVLAGYVWYHVEVDGVLHSLVRMWKAGEHERNAGAATWITEPATTCFALSEDILASVPSLQLDDQTIRTLLPWSLKNRTPV